jgi:hypothetical protein
MAKKIIKKRRRKQRKSLAIVKVIKDIKAYNLWVKTIKAERDNMKSKYNIFGLNHNYFYVLYFPVTLPQEDAALPDNIKRMRLLEILNPVHQYLDTDLGFADFIVPEFNQFFDDEGEPTLTYGVVYRFAFKRFSLRWLITRTLGIGIVIWALAKFNLLSLLWNLIF